MKVMIWCRQEQEFSMKSHYLGLLHFHAAFSFKTLCSCSWYYRFKCILNPNISVTFNLYRSALGYPEYHVFTPSQSIITKKSHYYQPQREFSFATKVLWRENPLQTSTLIDKFLCVSHYEWVKLPYILPSWRK